MPTYFENIIKSLKKIRLQRVLCIIFVSPTAVCTCNAVLGHACSTGVTRAWWLHNRYDSSSWLSHSLTFTYSITFNASYFVLKKFVLRNHIPSQLTSAYDVWGWFCFIRAGLKAGCRYNKTFRESLGRVSTQNGRYAIVSVCTFLFLNYVFSVLTGGWDTFADVFRVLHHVCIEDDVTGCFGRGMIGLWLEIK